VIPINPEKCPNVKYYKSEKFVNWLLDEKTKEKINSYKINDQQLFFTNIKN
jgi:tungstate transport system substrate-binding protein